MAAVEGPRFSVVDDNDHGGLLWITASLGLTYFAISCIVRILITYKNFHRDSVMLIVATGLGFVQTFLVYAQLSSGFGKSSDLVSNAQVDKLQKAGYVSGIFFMLALAASKCSVVWFIARLSPDKKHLMSCTIVFWASIAWGVLGVFLLTLRCSLAKPWDTTQPQCSNLKTHWTVIVAFDIILELALLAVIISIVWNLQMIRSTKIVVVSGFAFRLPLIALAAIHLHYINASLSSSNQTFDQITPSILEQVQLSWSLISATIPCLKAFIATLSSGYLGGHLGRNYATGRGYSNRSGYTGRSGTDEYAMKTLDTMGQSSHVRSAVIVGRRGRMEGEDATSTRSLTRVSREGREGNAIQLTRGYDIQYE